MSETFLFAADVLFGAAAFAATAPRSNCCRGATVAAIDALCTGGGADAPAAGAEARLAPGTDSSVREQADGLARRREKRARSLGAAGPPLASAILR